jgi:hypothetical protein
MTIEIDPLKGSGDKGSLSISLTGVPDPQQKSLVRQLVILKPSSRYNLSFSTTSEGLSREIAFGVKLLDASANGNVLAKSSVTPQIDPGWKTQQLEFETTPTTEAIYVSIELESCTLSPCQLQGKFWIDNFVLKES